MLIQIAAAMYALVAVLTAYVALSCKRRGSPSSLIEKAIGTILCGALWPLYWLMALMFLLDRS